MKIETRAYIPPKYSKDTIILLIILFSLIYFIIAVLIFKSSVLMLGLIPVAFFYSYYRYAREDPSPNLKHQISFTIDSIEINFEKFILSDIEKLVIEINEYDRQVFRMGRFSKILNGTNNKLSFTYQGLEISQNFYISSKARMNEFKDLYDKWYQNKIEFKELSNGTKTYCLESLNYKQIQEFKAKYKE